MVNSVFRGIKCLGLLITPIVCDILLPILLTCEFHTPTYTTHRPNVALMLDQRQRWRVNVDVTLAQRLLFAESVTHALCSMSPI